jgi:hypothetical protein
MTHRTPRIFELNTPAKRNMIEHVERQIEFSRRHARQAL